MDIAIQRHEEARPRPRVESMPNRLITAVLLFGHNLGSGILEDLKDKPGRTIIDTGLYATSFYALGKFGSLLSSAGIKIWKPTQYAVGYGLLCYGWGIR